MPNVSVRNASTETREWLNATRPLGLTLSQHIDSLWSGLRESKDLEQSSAQVFQLHPDAFTFVDLFAGIGGFHIGMKPDGGHCLFANE